MTRRSQGGYEKKTALTGVAAKPTTVIGVTAVRSRKASSKPAPATRKSAATKEVDEVPPDQRAFAANLTHLRKAAGLTQDELSARSGVSQSNISALEKGTWEPRLSTIMALARAFGVAPAALLPGT